MKKDKIQTSANKILKLTNVLVKEIDLKDSNGLDKEVFQMENYIKNRGAQPIGPLIQFTNVETSDTNEVKIVVKIMRQSNAFIHNVEEPYKMESIIRVAFVNKNLTPSLINF